MGDYPPTKMVRLGEYVIDKETLVKRIETFVREEIRFECIPWKLIGLWDFRVAEKDVERATEIIKR